MKHLTCGVVLGFFASGLFGCSKGSSSSDVQLVDKAMLDNFAAGVVVPTYQSFAARAADLQTALTALAQSPTQDTLDKARAAWMATRTPWEQNEAFLYGPVEVNGYDGAVDSWPLNKTDLVAVLDSGKSLDAALVGTLQENQKGFHTIEFLLYGETSKKVPGDFQPREFDYLNAAAANLTTIAQNLLLSWSDGVDGKPGFKETLATAGTNGNTVYPSLGAAGQEIVQGMANICNEVADSKIATPFDAQDPNLVESQFSFNSLRDFADNLRSVENSYKGALQGVSAPAGVSLSAHIATRDAALDQTVKDQIAAAIAAVQAIPEPFPTSLKDPTNADVIKKAQTEIRALRDTLTNKVLPLVTK